MSLTQHPKIYFFIEKKTTTKKTGPFLLILLLVLRLLLSCSYFNHIRLITPKQPPAFFTPDVKQTSAMFFYLCCSFLGQRRLPGRMWKWFLLLLCLSRYVALLLELRCCTVCLLTTYKASHMLDCKLCKTLPFMCACAVFF